MLAEFLIGARKKGGEGMEEIIFYWGKKGGFPPVVLKRFEAKNKTCIL